MSRPWKWLLVACALPSGCYDWTLGAAPRDAAPDSKTTAPEASTMHPPADAAEDRAADAVVVHEAAPAPDVTLPPRDAAPTCAMLHAAVDDAETQARNCSSAPANACQAHLPDQCECVVFVAEASSSATVNYIAAIKALKASGCPLDCATCPLPPEGSLCLSSEVGGMLTEACSQ